jgi:hypothetical protein
LIYVRHVRERIALFDPQAVLGVENTVAIRIDDPSAFLGRRGLRKLGIDREVVFARNRGVVGHAASIFDLLAERWRKHWLDPRLVEAWTYDAQDSGSPRFACTFGLPDGVRVELPPPLEKRIAVDGRFLDEVQISQGGNTSLRFPVERHCGVSGEDGTATVYAIAIGAAAVRGGPLASHRWRPVEVAIGGRKLGPMVLTEVSCSGESYRHDIAVLGFRRADAAATN